MKKVSLVMMLGVLVGALLVLPHLSWAFSTPTSGSFAYDLYDISANKMIKGAIGYVAALALAIWGIVNMAQTEFGPGAAKLGAGGLLAVITHVITTLGIIF